ncbi:hypothetical protein C5B85_02575 [Pseudoclavibacter sp. AY1F1]|nr:hypothetical protein C5B85_02575 [Pseudoclavibacter sp. AY1F1]
MNLRVRGDSAAKGLLRLALQHPVLDAKIVADELGTNRAATYRHLERLTEAGIFRAEGGDGALGATWAVPELIAILDRFARTSARMGH